MNRARAACPGALLGAALLAACAQEPPATLTLAADYSGCEAVLRGPVCVVSDDRPVRVWLGGEARQVEVDHARVLERETVAGGQRLSLRPGARAAHIDVTATVDGERRLWRLTLRRAAAVEPELSRARKARSAGRPDEAQALLAAASASSARSPAEVIAAYADHLAALTAIAQDDQATAIKRLQAAMAGYRAHDRLSELVDAATLAVFVLLGRRQFVEAGALLESLPARWGAPAESLYLADYYRGLLASYTGDLRTALRRLESAVQGAQRLGLEQQQRFAEQWLALQLQAVGRRAEAEALFLKLERDSSAELDTCTHALLLGNIGWNRLLTLEAGEDAADPRPPLHQALEAFAGECAAFGSERLLNAHVNLALANLHAGDLTAAAAELDAIRDGAELPLRLALWARDIEARIALARGDVDAARALYVALEQIAGQHVAPEARWRAVAGQARAAQLAGDVAGALAHWARAEALLDQEVLAVPVHEGRETFVARRESATRSYLGLLIDAGRGTQALEVARRARSRTLRGLRREDRLAELSAEERARWYAAMASYARQSDRLSQAAAREWELSAEARAAAQARRAAEQASLARQLDAAFAMLDRAPGRSGLPGRQVGEVVLLYYPLAQGWAGFVESDSGVEAVELDCVDGASSPQGLSNCLLGPFGDHLTGAQRIRVLPFGVLLSVDFHALPFGGATLLAAAPVSYGLDMERSAMVPPARALLVGDPRGDLPAAREEARLVQAALERAGVQIADTLTGDAANTTALRSALNDVDLLHYAGHAEFRGGSGWDSVLPLANNTAFGIGDILALPRVPALVMLSGCETGRTSTQAAPESLGLANAFLAAGSEVVIAAARPVADDVAAALAQTFYLRWTAVGAPDRALQQAQLQLAELRPEADWFSFRLVER